MDDGVADEPVEEWTEPGGGGDDRPSADEPVETWSGPSSDGEDEWYLEDEIPGSEPSPTPDRFGRIRKSAAGAMMTGIAIGFQKALEPERQEPAFVIKASSDPHDPEGPIELRFDPDDPTNTVAIVRSPSPSPGAELPGGAEDKGT